MLNAYSHNKIMTMDDQLIIFEALELFFHAVKNKIRFFDVNISFPHT